MEMKIGSHIPESIRNAISFVPWVADSLKENEKGKMIPFRESVVSKVYLLMSYNSKVSKCSWKDGPGL